MKVVVYFETKNFNYAEVVAQFNSSELYMACLPILKREAKKCGYKYVTESCRENERVTDESYD
jgi:hypothetical protein